jgi:hypothetical protein
MKEWIQAFRTALAIVIIVMVLAIASFQIAKSFFLQGAVYQAEQCKQGLLETDHQNFIAGHRNELK